MTKFSIKKAVTLIMLGVLIIFLTTLSGKYSSLNKEKLEATYSKWATTITNSCQNTTKVEDCLSEELVKLTTLRGLEFSFDVLERMSLDGDVTDCHSLAHSIASTEVEMHPDSWKDVMNNKCPTSCSYGCSHGALETSLRGAAIDQEDIAQICDQNSPPSCPHGLGHLLILATRNDLTAALALCDKLKDEIKQRYECATGIFMEIISGNNLVAHNLASTPDQDLTSQLTSLKKICLAQTNYLDSLACWKEIGPLALKYYSFSPLALSQFCDSSPNAETAWECQYRMIDLLAWKNNYSFNHVSDICLSKIGDDFRKNCFAKYVGSVMENFPFKVGEAGSFCNKLPESFKKLCYQSIGSALSRSTSDIKTKLSLICSSLESSLRKDCLTGSNFNLKPYLYR